MPEPQTPLYVRLAADQAVRLDHAASVSGKSKRRLVEDAVRHHLADDGLVIGRVQLTEEAADVLTVGEAAALLRIAEEQLIEASERSEVPARKIGNEWRFSRTALLDWLRGHGQAIERAEQPDQTPQFPTSP